MLTVYPDYYPRFQCLAGRCRHTCCAGWEIDIDADTRERYRSVPGDTGARLAAAVNDSEKPARFRLTAEERCPFLNGGNLCELILTAGNDSLLSQVCRDHPRFRSFLPGRTEVGVGLCCEAAAALVVSQAAPVRLLAEGREPDEDDEAASLLALRGTLLAAAQDRSRPLEARMEHILSLCGAELPERSMADWAVFYRRLERLDEAWTALLDRLHKRGDLVDIISFRHYMDGRETEYEQLLVYFLYRHVLKAYDDGDVTSKAAFAVLSTRLLFTLGAVHYELYGAFSPADQAEYARLYSAEIEYSEENLNALFDELCTGYGDA